MSQTNDIVNLFLSSSLLLFSACAKWHNQVSPFLPPRQVIFAISLILTGANRYFTTLYGLFRFTFRGQFWVFTTLPPLFFLARRSVGRPVWCRRRRRLEGEEVKKKERRGRGSTKAATDRKEGNHRMLANLGGSTAGSYKEKEALFGTACFPCVI